MSESLKPFYVATIGFGTPEEWIIRRSLSATGGDVVSSAGACTPAAKLASSVMEAGLKKMPLDYIVFGGNDQQQRILDILNQLEAIGMEAPFMLQTCVKEATPAPLHNTAPMATHLCTVEEDIALNKTGPYLQKLNFGDTTFDVNR